MQRSVRVRLFTQTNRIHERAIKINTNVIVREEEQRWEGRQMTIHLKHLVFAACELLRFYLITFFKSEMEFCTGMGQKSTPCFLSSSYFPPSLLLSKDFEVFFPTPILASSQSFPSSSSVPPVSSSSEQTADESLSPMTLSRSASSAQRRRKTNTKIDINEPFLN